MFLLARFHRGKFRLSCVLEDISGPRFSCQLIQRIRDSPQLNRDFIGHHGALQRNSLGFHQRQQQRQAKQHDSTAQQLHCRDCVTGEGNSCVREHLSPPGWVFLNCWLVSLDYMPKCPRKLHMASWRGRLEGHQDKKGSTPFSDVLPNPLQTPVFTSSGNWGLPSLPGFAACDAVCARTGTTPTGTHPWLQLPAPGGRRCGPANLLGSS
jgi:hypothetical protein